MLSVDKESALILSKNSIKSSAVKKSSFSFLILSLNSEEISFLILFRCCLSDERMTTQSKEAEKHFEP
ncbi:hypothetical protein [uncultured Gammaproteobacteria bacterium]|nr:hypothetical protein [uncultured Gammaproteobacteria bacterium]